MDRSSKPLRAASAAVGMWFGLMALGGEAVRFSESESAPALPDSFKVKEKKRALESPIDRNSSLSGVPALPFYLPSAAVAPRRLTPKEREAIERKNNWITRDPEEFGLNDKTAKEALGVREWSIEESDGRRKGGLEQTVKLLEDKKRRESDQNEESGSGGRTREEKDASGTLDSADGRDNAKSPTGDRGTGDFTPGETSPTARFGSLWPEPGYDRFRLGFVQEGMSDALRSSTRSAAAMKAQATRAEEFKAMLGSAPGTGRLPNPLGGGALDPVNVTPDLTRKDLNPVVVRGGPDLSPAPRLTFSDTAKPSVPAFAPFGPLGLIEGHGIGSLSPVVTTPTLGPATPRPKPSLSPLVLEIPQRNF